MPAKKSALQELRPQIPQLETTGVLTKASVIDNDSLMVSERIVFDNRLLKISRKLAKQGEKDLKKEINRYRTTGVNRIQGMRPIR